MALLSRRGHRIKTDVCEEDNGCTRQHSRSTVGQKRMPVGRIHSMSRANDKDHDGRKLDQHHHVIRAGAFFDAAHQNPGEQQQHHQSSQVEDTAGVGAVDERGTGYRLGQMDMKHAIQQIIEIGRESRRHRHIGDSIFEDEIPSDDPGKNFAQRRIGVGIRAPGNRNHGGKFCVTKRRKTAHESRNQKRK